MTNGFPVSAAPRPAYFLHLTGATRNNTWYVGDTGLTFTLNQPDGHPVTATGWTVRDFYGTVAAAGTMPSGTTTLALATPVGGWKPGWYRLYLSGASTDAVFGASYGVTNFQVLRPDAHFPAMPARATPNGTNGGAPVDAVMRGVCGIGPQRYSILNAASPSADIADIQNCLTIEASYYKNPAYQDAARPRDLLVSFPNGGYDVVGVGGLRAFAKTPGAANIYIQVATGTSNGYKVTVATPDAATVVETYDNMADVAAVIAAASGSTRVVFTGAGSTGVGGPYALGNAFYSGVLQVVQALYPAGVTWFEGPINEPTEDGSGTIAEQMRVFTAAVHAGNAAAKALGPNHVTESYGAGAMLNFLAHNGGAYCDGLSYHPYNMHLGDPNIGRAAYDGFAAALAAYPAQTSGKQLWQTEQGVFVPLFGTYMPRKARWLMQQLILQDQYGVPRERNHVWYDQSHGFWSQPTWLLNADTSPNPQVTLTRVMAEEVFGKQYEAPVDFGDPGKRMFLGNSYRNPFDGTRVLALIAGSPLDDPTVALALSGTGVPSTVTVVDGFGNTSTATVASGRVVVSVADIPTYVRLPANVTAAVYRHGTFPPAASTRTNIANPAKFAAAISAPGATRANFAPLAQVTSGVWQGAGYNYNNSYQSAVTALPDSVAVHWTDHPNTIDRVVVWAGFAYQAQCTLLVFDVQTSNDGTTWTTRATVDKSAQASSFAWGSDDQNSGTSADTYWPEQWIFDIPLPTKVRASYVRLLVQQTSLGGAPDATSVTAGNLADDGNQRVTISQLGIYSDDSVVPRYVSLA